MSQQLIEGIHYYLDSNGYTVLTEKFHLEKGYCCGHGCRHCPYRYECVPEPRRSQLLSQKESDSATKQ